MGDTPKRRRAKPAPPRAAGHEAPQNRDLHRLLVEGVRDYAIFALDPTGHVLTWNAGAERINGYTADEII
jgi:PAS domain-containing protein